MSNEISMKQILVPLDGSDSCFVAAKRAVILAKMAKAELIFMHAVVNLPYVEYESAGLARVQYIDEAKRHAEMWYMNAGDMASKEDVKFSTETVLNVASIANSIVNYAESKNVDLIVMGTKGRTGIKRFLLGSVASGVVAHAKCSVLVVR